MRLATALGLGVLFWTTQASAQTESQRFQPQDAFALEWAADPQISPDGQRIVYMRNFMDAAKDRRRSNLWIINFDGTDERPLTTGLVNDGSPRCRALVGPSSADTCLLRGLWPRFRA